MAAQTLTTKDKTAPMGRAISILLMMESLIVAHRTAFQPLRYVGVILCALSISGCAWLDSKQRQWVLRPTPTHAAVASPAIDRLRSSDVRYKVPVISSTETTDRFPAAQELSIWWLPHESAEAPALLYLHGTFRNLYQNLPKIDALRNAGFAVLAVDYRGWGDSSPIIPSEASISSDVHRAWLELVKRQPQARRRVIFGHSMGGAAAITLASQLRHGEDYGALIVESTFTRLPDVAAEAGFWGRVAAAVTTLKFDSLSKIGRVDAPILMMHGTSDKTVPIQLGRRLRDAAPAGVRWVEFPGGSHSRLHSEAPDAYRHAVRELIAELDKLGKPDTSAGGAVRP